MLYNMNHMQLNLKNNNTQSAMNYLESREDGKSVNNNNFQESYLKNCNIVKIVTRL